MRWVTANHRDKKLLIEERHVAASPFGAPRGFEDSITRRAIHEFLFRPSSTAPLPLFPALLAARAALTAAESPGPSSPSDAPRILVFVDPAGTFYPPAAAGLGIALEQICVLRPSPADLLWATIESLRCPSVGAVVALVTQRLTRVEVRRLQLAAEKGTGAGLLLRPDAAAAGTYAAATRWAVTPAPGERAVQRWNLRFVHGHGGHIGQSFLLEKHRASGQTNFVRLLPPLVHHPLRAAVS